MFKKYVLDVMLLYGEVNSN